MKETNKHELIKRLMTKQVIGMTVINKIENHDGDNDMVLELPNNLHEAVDLSEIIADYIPLPKEGTKVCSDGKTWNYCREWVFEGIYRIAHHSKTEDYEACIKEFLDELFEHSDNVMEVE